MPALARRLAVLVLLLAPATLAAQARRAAAPKEYVIVHGAWGGGWDWKAVDSALTARGHHVHRVTLTGLGERVHLASPSVGLQTHIMDVVNTIRFENLRDVILVGHSYGGMVITGAADAIPDRVRRVVYVDAFLPDSGESLAMLAQAEFNQMVASMVKEGMLIPGWVKPDAEAPMDVPHPLKTLSDTIALVHPAARRIPGSYILTIDKGATTDSFSPMAARAATRAFKVDTLITDHTPERSAIPALVRLLLSAR